MKSFFFAGVLFAVLACEAEELVWQLGTADGNHSEFAIPYNSWEYGRALKLAKDPAMNHKTMTYHYNLPNNVVIPNPVLPAGISSAWIRSHMPAKEVVTGLEISWNETEAGNRKVSFVLSGYSCYFPDLNGITLSLPDGHVRDFGIPVNYVRKNAGIALKSVFAVKPGKNTLKLGISTTSKMYRIWFDFIKLEKTEEMQKFETLLRFIPEQFAGIYHPGMKSRMNLHVLNSKDGTVKYSITDYYGKKVKNGTAEYRNGKGMIELFNGLRGWYQLKVIADGKIFVTAYAVTEPVKNEFIPDSRFGCHAISGSELNGNPEVHWLENDLGAVKKAFLGGARKIRIHGYQWHDMEPKKGKYRFESLRKKTELAKPYRFYILLDVFGTPFWASSSQNRKFTVSGQQYGKMYPPKNWQDWRNFLPVLLKEVKQLGINAIEFGNEPGFVSAFWPNGSAKDYAEFLKIAYEESKKVAPEIEILSGAPLTVDFFEAFMKENGNKPYFDTMSVHYLRNQDSSSFLSRQWRTSLNRYGENIPLVNSEESGYSGKDPVKFAEDVVKLHVREAKNGIKCTYGFRFFQYYGNYKPRYYSCFALENVPKPGFAAYRTMTHRLEHAEYVADLSNADCEIYLFDRKGVPVIVFWGKEGSRFSLPLKKNDFTLIDLMDREHEVSGGQFEASKEPRFIEGGDIRLLKEWSMIVKDLPKRFSIKPGDAKTYTISVSSPNRLTALELPNHWKGSVLNGRISIRLPKNASFGRYNGFFVIEFRGRTEKYPFIIDVRGEQNGDLIKNGNFERGPWKWFNLGKTEKSEIQDGIGRNGSKGLRIKGTFFFGPTNRVKVRKGEKYLLAADIRGTGRIGGVIVILDADKKRIYPKKEGINSFRFSSEPEWKTVYELIEISQDNADQMRINFLANYAMKEGELYLDNIRLIRLDMETSIASVLYTGEIQNASSSLVIDGVLNEWRSVPRISGEHSGIRIPNRSNTRWNGAKDLSAYCQLMRDSRYLYLAFTVMDDVDILGKNDLARQWENDSLQCAINPENGYSSNFMEFLICRDESGKPFVFKYKDFWTPEILTNVIRRGVVPDAEIAVIRKDGVTVYEIAIPWNQVYPLKSNQKSFGFSWLVNDNDGNGRKYLEWSSGISGKKNSKFFGIIRANGE